MNRCVERDLAALTTFLSTYSLNEVVSKPLFQTSLQKGHSAYLTLLTFWSEVNLKAGISEVPLLDKKISTHDLSFLLIKEAVSDLGSSLFCCLHGAYKPGHMALRSCIENYVRAITGVFNPAALNVTSVFELFDLAKASPPFKTTVGALAIQRIQNSYKELCKFSHSATLAHMAGIKSLDHFPTVDPVAFDKWAKEAKIAVEAILRSFLDISPLIYAEAHFRVKDVIEPYLTKPQRLKLLGA